MVLKVKAQERLQTIGTYKGEYRYVMAPEYGRHGRKGEAGRL